MPKQLTIEQLQYGKPKEYKPKIVSACLKSKIEPRQDLYSHTSTYMHGHAGTIAHVCISSQDHADPYCNCQCGHRWRAILEPASQRRIAE